MHADTEATHNELTMLSTELGVTLDVVQLNIGGERALMSPHKYVLMGTLSKSGERIVLKCAKHARGVTEIEEEHHIHEALENFSFSQEQLAMPEELLFTRRGTFTALITRYIEQDKVFTDHDLTEQFFMALQALESQESFHATTREHHASILKKFHHHTPAFYRKSIEEMTVSILEVYPAAEAPLSNAQAFIKEHAALLETYDGYLMHSDFVPHNFRIKERQLYLLDFVSFTLGNKYESWARFINFMEVHSSSLVPLLLTHILKDRGPEEYLVLRLMRIYKIIFLMHYYAESLSKTRGDLRVLTSVRLELWTQILRHVLTDTAVSQATITEYHAKRSQLRTPEEKERQRQFTWA